MKIYLDSNNKVIGYETVFYDKKKEKRPITDLDNGNRQWGMFLSEKQNNFIREHLDKGGRITQLALRKDGTFLVENEQQKQGDCVGCPKTVMVDTSTFKVNADIKRHLKNKEEYKFMELQNIPFDGIKEKYLYFFDKSIIEFEKRGKLNTDKSLKRYFGLFTENNVLVAFIYTLQKEIPIIMILYQDELFDNTGYIILSYLIDLFKKEGIRYLDLGGLTRQESGINQFKRKFGSIIPIADRFLYSGK